MTVAVEWGQTKSEISFDVICSGHLWELLCQQIKADLLDPT